MSLINDALRRAKQAQQQKPPPLPSQQLRPAETAQRRSNLLFLLPAVIVLLSAVGGVLIWIAFQKSGTLKPATSITQQSRPATEAAVDTVESKPTIATSAPQPVQQIETSSVEKPATVQAQNTVVTNEIAEAAKQVATETNTFVLPTLKGVYFNPSRPSAVLNSKTVYVGDSVSGFRVLAISKQTVTIEGKGQTNVLTLEE